MKKIMMYGLITFILFIVVGCDKKTTGSNNSSNNLSNNLSNNSSNNSINNMTETSHHIIPVPASDTSVEANYGTYYDNISVKSMEDYLQNLIDEGWKNTLESDTFDELTPGTSQYMLTKGNDVLQIIMFLVDRENESSNSVLVRMDEEVYHIDIKNRKDVLTKNEALESIELYLDNMEDNEDTKIITINRENITVLLEIFIEDAYEKMDLQAYLALSDTGIGAFLIRKGVVSYVRGTLENTCVADIDGDESYELLDLYGWGSGIYRIELSAYEYCNPIYFSSYTEIPIKEYFNCFVPDIGYAELRFKKVNDTTVMLVGTDEEYGIIKTDGGTLVLENMEDFPFKEWSKVYDQSLSTNIEKEFPIVPPEIIIAIDGCSIDYVVQTIKWDGEDNIIKNAYTEIMNKDQFIPTFKLDGLSNENNPTINIDFGNSVPDSITVYDSMLNEQGANPYNDSTIMERTVTIKENGKIEFELPQHMAYGLSSNSADYSKDWYRLFRLLCKWGENVCEYSFLINTGNEESLVEITDDKFLVCGGEISALSSNWGIDLSIDSKELPDQYIIEWQISDGTIRKWDKKYLAAINIMDSHNGYPMTSSEDDNNGAVIWVPLSFDYKEEDITVGAYIYKSRKYKNPIAYSEIIIKNTSGTLKAKE